MAVDKRQRREKHTKSGTKEGLRTRLRTSGEKNSHAAGPIYIRQGEEKKHIKRGAKTEPLSSFLLLL